MNMKIISIYSRRRRGQSRGGGRLTCFYSIFIFNCSTHLCRSFYPSVPNACTRVRAVNLIVTEYGYNAICSHIFQYFTPPPNFIVHFQVHSLAFCVNTGENRELYCGRIWLPRYLYTYFSVFNPPPITEKILVHFQVRSFAFCVNTGENRELYCGRIWLPR